MLLKCNDFLFLAYVVCTCVFLVKGGFCASWRIIHGATSKQNGHKQHPSIRYQHSAVNYKDTLFISLGYYYDRSSNDAVWLSDTWSMQLSGTFAWQLLHNGITDEKAHDAYKNGRLPGSPSGRFGHSAAVIGDKMYLYGGHDGGMSRHGRKHYDPSYDFAELWAFDFLTSKWRYVNISSSTDTPRKRYKHSLMEINGKLVLYGGISSGQGDVWILDVNIPPLRWNYLATESATQSIGLGHRLGFATVSIKNDYYLASGFVVVGGRNDKKELKSDVFFYDESKNIWREVSISGGNAPKARMYHAMTSVHINGTDGNDAVVHILSGGTTTSPELSCASDTWALILDCEVQKGHWIQLPDMIIPLFDHTLTPDSSGSVYLFGGHLCSQTLAGNPFYYSNFVHNLNVQDFASILVSTFGCEGGRKKKLSTLKQSIHEL